MSFRSISPTSGKWTLCGGSAVSEEFEGSFSFSLQVTMGSLPLSGGVGAGRSVIRSSSRSAHAGDLVEDFMKLTCLAIPAFLNNFKFEVCSSGGMLPVLRATRDAVRPWCEGVPFNESSAKCRSFALIIALTWGATSCRHSTKRVFGRE